MSNSLSSSISRILIESNDPDISGKYTLFTLYNDNTAILHIFEDEGTYQAMKHKFTSNDNIKRLGAAHLPENTTFKKLSESIEKKFGVPRGAMGVRTHPKDDPNKETVVEQIQKPTEKPRFTPKKASAVNQVLNGKERFKTPPSAPSPLQEDSKETNREPTINSFKPATSKKIDLSRLNNGDQPPLGL